MSRALGWKKDPVDDRDHDATAKGYLKVVAVPAKADNSDLVKIVDQGQLGSCTANGSGQAVRGAELLEQVERAANDWREAGGDPAKFDAKAALAEAQAQTEFWARLFPYYLARAYDGTVGQDAGTNIRTIFQAINKYGYPPESAWPYSDDSSPSGKFAQMPPPEVFREAYDQRQSADNVQAKVIDYARITEIGAARVDVMKQAMAQRHLIVFGTTVTEKFCSDMSANNGNPIDPPTVRDAIAGGHAMSVGGYDAQGAFIVNSWGTSFGLNGWAKFSWDYMTWAETTDLWIVRRAPIFARIA